MKRYIIAILMFLLLLSCSENDKKPDIDNDPDTEITDSDNEEVDKSDSLFTANHLVEVKIEMAEQDWEKIRYEGRGIASMMSSCIKDYEYTYVKATVTVNGVKFENAGVRKKGFLGSLSALKPSFKINFEKFGEEQKYMGMKRLTLNNDKQDPSHTHQVMSYALFRKAGVPAPRCNLARVSVNGVDLGIYSNVESIKKPFILRNFGNDDGNLYEGQVADFTPRQMLKFQLKTNEKDTDGLDELQKVVDALYVTDTDLKKSLEKVIDLDAFLTFWAMESITGHWDGYSGNKNNFYTYHNPETGLFSFIPWGTDGSFEEGHSFLDNVPNSVYAASQIANRLYNNPETRDLYHNKLKYILENIWNTEELLAQVNQIGNLTKAPTDYLEEQRNYISKRKKAILDELNDKGPEWPYDTYQDVAQCRDPYPIKGSFSTGWTNTDNFKQIDKNSLEMTFYGEKQVFTAIYNDAGPILDENENIIDGTAQIKIYATRAEEKTPILILLYVPTEFFPDGTIPFHGSETVGMAYEIIGEGNSADFKQIGYIGDGNITMTKSGTGEGDSIVGTFEALLSRSR